nr:hypothetical protein B0A51_01378 [Rachicladosporium sp. CCFEE 5018]
MAHHTTLPRLLEPTAIDNALALVKKFGSIDAIPPLEVMKLNRADALAVEWYEHHGKDMIDNFLFEKRGFVLTRTVVGTLSVEAQQVLAWEKAKPKKQYRKLTFEQYVGELRNTPFLIMNFPPELRCLIWAQHMLRNDVPINISDVTHDKQRLSRNASAMLNHEIRAESFAIAWQKTRIVFRVPNGPQARTVAHLDKLVKWLDARGDEVVNNISEITICCSTKLPRTGWTRRPVLYFDELREHTKNIRQTYGFRWGGVVEGVDRAKGVCGHVCDDKRGHVVLMR